MTAPIHDTSPRPIRIGALALSLLALAGAPAPPVPPSAPAAEGRVIVLGFDGADARTTQALMDAGRLPNLARLAEQGTFAPLRSTNPAESAAGWAALNTGTNPLVNGVPSFIKRRLSPIMPDMGHVEIKDAAVADMQLGGLMKVLSSNSAAVLAAGAGVLVLLVFLILLRGLLRVKTAIAAPLALILAGVGAWGATRAKGYVPENIGGVYHNRVDQEGFWDVAARAGVRSIVLDAALAFGRPTVDGARVLGGLGIPDVRGGPSGEWFIYTTDDLELSRPPKGDKSGTSSGYTFRVDERGGAISTSVYGPKNFWEIDRLKRELADIKKKLEHPDQGFKESNELKDRQAELEKQLGELAEERVSLPMEVVKKDGKARVTIGGQTQELAEREWSDWYRCSFRINPLISADTITRVNIVSMDDPFEMYVGTFEYDPASPSFWQPVSEPMDFSKDLTEWIGSPFETLGWSCMTNQIKDKKVSIDLFLEDIEFTMGWRRQLTSAALERDDWEVLFSVFSTPDRLQHMMYKYYDVEHPYHDPAEAARTISFFGKPTTLADTIPAIYEQMDAIVGDVMDNHLEPGDTLLLCADHGFTSYRRGLHVNNWLAENGYLTLKAGVQTGHKVSPELYADWSKTKAYALGLGMVYLNLEGREPKGIVKPSEADEILSAIREDFLALTDPGDPEHPFDTPARVGHDAVVLKDIYEGPVAWGGADYACADLQLGFAEHYRVSWETVSGQIRLAKEDGAVVLGDMFSDNSNNWSGDHASNSPDVVTGIFFSNRKVEIPAEGVSVMHIAPTALGVTGVEVPERFEYPALKFVP